MQCTRRSFLTRSAVGLAGIALAGQARPSQAAASEGARPNIIFVTTDDQGLEAGCYGDPYAITPNIDRLAEEGVLFEEAYVTTATCSPSRSSMLTGLYPHQNEHWGLANHHYSMREGIPNLFGILKDAGYRTGIIGKLHVMPQNEFPFDVNHSQPSTRTRQVRQVAEEAAEIFQTEDDAPFFLMINYFDPHRPLTDEDNQIDGIPETIQTPDEISTFPWLGVDTPEVLAEVATYYNCVQRLDIGLGMVLDELEAAGKTEDTLIIFIGDHGAPFSRAKTTCYEAGVKIPFIVRWPGKIETGLRHDAFVSTVDILPTFLEAAGVSLPAPVAGESLLPLCRGEEIPWREMLATEFNAHAREHYYPRRSIRDRRFKLIHNLLYERPNPVASIGPASLQRTPPGSAWRTTYETTVHPPEYELYDLQADPYEMINLAVHPDYQEALERLQTALRDWQEESDDPMRDPDFFAAMTREHDEAAEA